MSSDSAHDTASAPPADARVVHRLLDPVFGFFVWAGHLLVIYIANAISCVLGLTSGSPRAESLLVTLLAVFSLATAAVVGVHGLRRYRQRPGTAEHEFLFRIAVGQDAIAALAILWQLFPIFMSPVCR